MNDIVLSLIKNAVLGFVVYLIISVPREYLRLLLLKLIFHKYETKTVFLKKTNFFSYIDPIGLATFLFLDFGWTHTPAIDYTKLRGKYLFVYSLLGIISSLILFLTYGIISSLIDSAIIFKMFYMASKWSLTLALVSLFPIPPLDGSRMILSFLPSNYYEWYIKFSFYGILFMLGLIFFWILPMIMQPLIIFISIVTNFVVFRNW